MPGAKETMSGRALHLTLSAVVMLTAAPGFSRAAPAPPTMALGAIWDARWIAHPQVPGSAFSVQHFRRVVEPSENPKTWRVHVSADPRCRLFVNGVEVWTGPARSDLEPWPFVTLDLAPRLRRGSNILGATVWNHGEHNPWSQLRQMTGGGIEARVALPAGVTDVFSWGGTERALAAGTQTVAITGKAEKAK